MSTARAIAVIAAVSVLTAVLVVLARDREGGSIPASANTPVLIATAPAFTDPRLLATFFFERVVAGDWPALQPLLAEEYQDFSYGADRPRPYDHYISYIPTGVTLSAQPSDWEIEEEDTRVVARFRGPIPYVIVMRRLDDETLRVDPGPCARQMAAFWRARPDGFAGLQIGLGYRRLYQVDASTDDRIGELLRAVHTRFDDQPQCVSYADGAIQVTVAWWFRQGHGSLATTGLFWTAGDERGPARVVWTDAQLHDGVLTFPLEDMPYILTILLERAPVDTEVHLQIKGITSHDPVEGDLVFGLDVLPLGRP